MHYVTEDELREAYGTCPFEKYELPKGARGGKKRREREREKGRGGELTSGSKIR